ncbi:hypothetical protein [Pararhizobium sp. LjRoot238]|uniref:hypothetical protein n=1 Tax=Pararhizobium sp. LjRoot238 TaxID=3342293 RepID=UPI003ECCBB3E
MEEQTKKEEPVQRKILWGKQMPFLQFVVLSRIAVNKMEISPFCGLRRCARKGRCAGKLMRRKIPRVLSNSDDLTVWLPLCIAGADDQWLEGFTAYWEACRNEYFERPIRPPEAEPEILPLCEEWPHADACEPETLPPFLYPLG